MSSSISRTFIGRSHVLDHLGNRLGSHSSGSTVLLRSEQGVVGRVEERVDEVVVRPEPGQVGGRGAREREGERVERSDERVDRDGSRGDGGGTASTEAETSETGQAEASSAEAADARETEPAKGVEVVEIVVRAHASRTSDLSLEVTRDSNEVEVRNVFS